MYDNLYRELFANATAIEINFDQIHDMDKLIFLFYAPDICFQTAETCFYIL